MPTEPNIHTPRSEAKTAKGRAKVEKILEVAKTLFTQGGYGEMTMRQVAEHTGMSLSNVQHYFPAREDLLRALLESVMDSYDPAFGEIETREIDPKAKLEAAIRYLLEDTKRSATERLFVEIWSLATRDAIAREIFDKMYTHHRQNLGRLISAANTDLSSNEIQQRAALVSMQIEGLMLLINESKPKHPELDGIEEECVAAIMNVVLRTSSRNPS